MNCRRTSCRNLHESLESRTLFNIVLLDPVADQNVLRNASPTVLDLSSRYDNADVGDGTLVRLDTTKGSIYLELFNSAKPTSAANFLSYLNSGAYDDTIFHSAGRLDNDNSLARQFLSAGGYTLPDLNHIATSSAIADELSTNGLISNTRGTIAFDLPSGANSAASDFFINLSSDSPYTSTRNSTNTVFGQLINNSLSVADAIAGEPIFNFPSTGFNSLPLQNYTTFPDQLPADSNYMTITGHATVQPYTISVSSDNSALVSPTLNGNSLTLNYGANQSGSANVTIAITALDGSVTQDTFAVTVGQDPTTFTEVNLGLGGSKSVVYTDSDGTLGTLALALSSGTVRFTGTNVAQSTLKGRTTVTGDNLVVSSINVDAATPNRPGTLAIAAKGGDRQVQIGSITGSAAALRAISGAVANVTGQISLVGDVAAIVLNSSAGISVSGNITGIKLASVTGNITISGNVRSFFATSMTGDLSISGNASSVKILTHTGDVTVNGLLSAGVFITHSGNVQVGTLRALVATTMTGNLSVTSSAASVKSVNFTGNVTVGTNAIALALGIYSGNISINGTARSIVTRAISNSNITIGSSDGRTVLTFVTGDAVDVGLSSAEIIRVIKATSWTSTGSLETISAPAILALAVTGNFAPNVTVTGANIARTVASAVVRGQIQGGLWNITGNVGTIFAGSIASGWNETITGTLAAFRVNSDLNSNLDAGTILSAVVIGNLTGNVTARDAFNARTYSLKKLVVTGAMTDSFVQSTGSINVISAGSMSGTHIFAGIGPSSGNLPDDPTDFASAARINAVAVKINRIATTFSESTVAASILGKMTLGSILTFANSGLPFGVAGQTIASVFAQGNGEVIRASRLTTPAQSLTREDFQVRVVPTA